MSARRRILIIDDEEGVRTSLRLILEDEGYDALDASGPEEALGILEESSFDVVLCDVRMPRRSGLDLLPDIIASSCFSLRMPLWKTAIKLAATLAASRVCLGRPRCRQTWSKTR